MYLTACAFTYSKLKSSLCPCPSQPSNRCEYSQEHSSKMIFQLTCAYLQLTITTNLTTLFATPFPRMHGQTEIEEISMNFSLQRCCCCCAPTSLPELNASRLFCVELVNMLLLKAASPSSLLLGAQFHILYTTETRCLAGRCTHSDSL